MYDTKGTSIGFMNEHELEGSRSESKSGPCVIAACVMIETETQSTKRVQTDIITLQQPASIYTKPRDYT